MQVLVLSANMGGFEKPVNHEEQLLPEGIDRIDFRCVTDETFPPRSKSMTPRLQARIVKCFGWQMFPDYDYYLWIDSSCRLAREDSVQWFMEKVNGDIAVFKHPRRNTVQEEADFLKERIILEKEGRKQQYILPRYENEDIDGQLLGVDPKQELYASTAFIYRNNSKMRHALKDWWYHISRWHSIDQLSLPFVLFENNCQTNVIADNYLKCKYLEPMRK